MTIISVFVSSPDTHSERRLDSTLSVAELKVGNRACTTTLLIIVQDKLVPITGIAPQYQRLRLYSTTEASPVLAELADDNRTLASYGVQEFQNIRAGPFGVLKTTEMLIMSDRQSRSECPTWRVQQRRSGGPLRAHSGRV